MKDGESMPDHREFAEAIRDGDESAFDAYLTVQWTPLVRYLSTFLGSIDDAKDIAQEAFVRLWERRSGLRPSGSLRAYLYQVARNLAINEMRRRELHGRLGARQVQEQSSVRTPARELDQIEVREVVQRAIGSLPARRREAFVLAHLQNLPHREVAEIMGVSAQTVANQISAALGDLREVLHPYIADGEGGDMQGAG